MDERDDEGWLNHEAMEGHIWRLAMDKTILLSMIAVVLLAVMAVSKVGLVTSMRAPADRRADTTKARPVFLTCEGGQTSALSGEVPDSFEGRTVAIVADAGLGACIDSAYARGASAVVLGQTASTP